VRLWGLEPQIYGLKAPKASNTVTRTSATLDRLAEVEDQLRNETPDESKGETEPTIQPAHVLPPDQWHSLSEIEFALGIPEHVVREAFTKHHFHQYQAPAGPTMKLWGADILAWITAHRIPYAVTEQAAAIYRRRNAEPNLKPEPQPQTETILDKATAIAKAREQAKAEDIESHRQRAFSHYIRILLRGDQADDEDAMTLANVMADLDITPDQAQRDRDLIVRAKELQGRYDRREQATARYHEAAAAYRSMRERHEREERAASRERDIAENEMSMAAQASNELIFLARSRPHFFDCSTHPPRLRGSTIQERGG